MKQIKKVFNQDRNLCYLYSIRELNKGNGIGVLSEGRTTPKGPVASEVSKQIFSKFPNMHEPTKIELHQKVMYEKELQRNLQE